MEMAEAGAAVGRDTGVSAPSLLDVLSRADRTRVPAEFGRDAAGAESTERRAHDERSKVTPREKALRFRPHVCLCL